MPPDTSHFPLKIYFPPFIIPFLDIIRHFHLCCYEIYVSLISTGLPKKAGFCALLSQEQALQDNHTDCVYKG
ncbi:MAG: hypothetical protein B6245_05650 [Desulfobacteraceae bacterium 4572_88]|nr:MAG: hypothetical protein B6245_05650 [Desulfobacteraceae bacterium 4572_88]